HQQASCRSGCRPSATAHAIARLRHETQTALHTAGSRRAGFQLSVLSSPRSTSAATLPSWLRIWVIKASSSSSDNSFKREFSELKFDWEARGNKLQVFGGPLDASDLLTVFLKVFQKRIVEFLAKSVAGAAYPAPCLLSTFFKQAHCVTLFSIWLSPWRS